MKVAVLFGLYLVIVANSQADARSIGYQGNIEMPKFVQETLEQSFSCAMQLGPQAASIPQMPDVEKLPEDNLALNKLWGCIWKKREIINDNGDLNVDKLEQYLIDGFSVAGPIPAKRRDELRDVAKECSNEKAADYGLKAVKIQNCLNALIEKRELKS